MTIEKQEVVPNQDADKDAGEQPTVEELQAELAAAHAEAAKLKGIRDDLKKQRDDLKKKVPAKSDSDEDYKSLWEESNQKLTKMQEAIKSRDVKDALRTKLLSSKVQADKIEAALQLADQKLVEWDEEEGVRKSSVDATVQKLKGSFGWLFESKVAGTPEPKSPSEGSSSDKTITRAEWSQLSPQQQRDKIVVEKFKVVD